MPRRIELDRVRFLFYAHCRLCSSNSSVRHPGIRIFTRSNWKLHFPPMPPAFPYSLVLSFSYDSFCFDRRYSFFVSAAPFIARILLLRFPFIVQPLFSRPDIVFPRATISPSTLSSNCFLLFLKFLSRLADLLPILILPDSFPSP